MNWMNLRQWLGSLARDTGSRLDRVAPAVSDAEPPATHSSPVSDAKSAALFWSEATISSGQATPQHPNRRAARIRSWRKRALSRKGARLYSAMQANSQTGALAMLDEGGMVVSWYERTEDGAALNDGVVDNHMSQFYVAADLALGLPVRDLCSAAIHGRSMQTGWRRFPDGGTCWATTVIEPIWLRDGRLQGFSHVTSRSSDAHQNVRAVKVEDQGPRRLKISALRPAVASAMLVLMVLGNFAHADNAIQVSLPDNARKSPYGNGWDCVSGYVRGDEGCTRVKVPANAYLDASGSSWACERGYKNANNACSPVQLPSNAYLDNSYGAGWKCLRGYREERDACVTVVVPANAHAVDSSYGSGWECNRGFRSTSGACVAVAVPTNAYLVRQGDDWKCDRGFTKAAEACVAVMVPANAYLDSQGNSWNCERGFRRGNTNCEAVPLPTNSHLSYSGDNWRCDSGYRRQGELCITD